jgi:hypothetical protein
VEPYITDSDCADPLQGGCDPYNIWYWLADPCTLAVKIDFEGSVAVVHQNGLSSKSDNGKLFTEDDLGAVLLQKFGSFH